MKLSDVLIQPYLTEKANKQSESAQKYSFKVDKKANKLEIEKAVKEFYNVTVLNVNTCVMPGKNKSKFTKGGFIKGKKSSYKKAVVTIKEGESIDIYGAI